MAGRRAKRGSSTQADPPILVASRVGKAIDGNVLLRPLDVSVAPGRCVVLRGENGSGKTTLLRILAGTLDPSEGSATVDGAAADERDPAVRETVAALIGAPTAYRDLTLLDHLVLIDATWGRGDGSDDRAEGLLASLEIGHLSERFPHELSSGQQQLFHLAMVLGRPARVLLLDEPEQRLDTHKRGLLADLLVARKEAGAALVVACHDPDLTTRIADRVVDVLPGMSVDSERLADAREVLAGEDRQRSQNAVYAVYVAVIVAGAYGVPAAQAMLRFVDPPWLATHLGGIRGVLLGAVVLVAALALAYRLGGVRGPVVPPLPYLDTIAASPLDRALVLRPWWRLGLLGCLVGGLLIGLVIGAGLAIAALTSAVVLLPAVGVGTAVGLLVAGTWLHGQVRSWPTGARGAGVFLRQRRSLRALHLTALRSQAASAVTVGGAVLIGDLRAARLDVASPTTRGRRWRLRASGRTSVMVARDWLGLRRAAGTGVAGLLLVAAGGYALVQSATPGTPSIIALAGLVLAYLGVSAWSEGLRLQGDNAGTPPLLGLDPSSEATAHLVLPGVGYVVTVLVVGGLAVVLAHATVLGIIWAVLMVGLLLAAQLMAAFRGLPPAGIFSPNAGVPVMILWYAVPVLVPVASGTAASAFLASGGTTLAVAVLAVTTWFSILYARRRIRVLFEQHRG